MRAAPILLLFTAGLALGCRASVRANVGVGGKAQVADFDEPLDPSQQSAAEAEGDEGTLSYAMLGARHDLRLAQQGTPACGCLAVALGQPNDATFRWESVVPRTNPDTQLVVALSAEGIDCPAAARESMGASYWGWRRSGDDVIVLVENARFGRPLTGGAIIPKPLGEGLVWVRPAGKDVAYGRPLDASQKDCKIGNPGPPRTTALSPDEDVRDDIGPMRIEEPESDEFAPAE